jgi:hypothetical protein
MEQRLWAGWLVVNSRSSSITIKAYMVLEKSAYLAQQKSRNGRYFRKLKKRQ